MSDASDPSGAAGAASPRDPASGGLRVAVPIADILDRPNGRRERQLLMGEPVAVLEQLGGHVHVRAARDGYLGFVHRADLGDPLPATHRVTALATHIYARADLKAPDRATLSFGSLLTVSGTEEGFARLATGGFVPAGHLAPLARRFSDPAGVAEMFLGTPYLWGGNSRIGLDCSGLVQAACVACGLPCPGDADEQAAKVGAAPPEDGTLGRGDAVFWKGHCAVMVDETRMIHANAHHMAVAYELLEDAVARIAAQGEGGVTAVRRLTGPV